MSLWEKKVTYKQPESVKSNLLHKLLEELVSDSSTDTDVELSKREQIIANLVEDSPQPDTKIISNQDSGSTDHPEREDDITVIRYKPKAEREAICLPLYQPVSRIVKYRR